MTYYGGAYGLGVFFEWDPATNTYTKKLDFNITNGSQPYGSLTLKDGKLYGMTSKGAYGWGVIFEWNPITDTYFKKLDFNITNGSQPYGSLTPKDGKLYGMTYGGGAYGWGIIFELDPTTNTYTKKQDFNGTNGRAPSGSLTLLNGKLYGMTELGGANNQGVVFEWDPVSNTFRKIKDLSAATGHSPYGDLTPLPAPVAAGTPGNCQAVASITIDATNNNTWVPFIDDDGNAVAEINANGNNLGQVEVSLFVHDGAPRENTSHTLFLDRNLTINVENPDLQPGTSVQARLYVLKSEYEALASGVNSQGQSPGIASISDVGVFKISGSQCNDQAPSSAATVDMTVDSWGEDYVFTISATSFSTFYFAAKEGALPVSLLSFTAEATPANLVKLAWSTAAELNAGHFGIERSTDARIFGEIAKVAAKGDSYEIRSYIHTDETPLRGRSYYRLRQVDMDGSYTYSKVVSVRTTGTDAPYPNPAKGGTIRIEARDAAALKLTDLSGRDIPFTYKRIDGEVIELQPHASLQPGVYLISNDGIGYKVVVE